MTDSTQAFTENELRQIASAMLAHTSMMRATGQDSGPEWDDAWAVTVRLSRRNLRNTPPTIEELIPFPAPAPVKPTHRWGFMRWDADSNCTHDRATVQHGMMDDFWHCPDCGGETDA
jgi:hypothetical protein